MTNSFRRMRNGGDRSYDTIKNVGWVGRAVMGSHSVGVWVRKNKRGAAKCLVAFTREGRAFVKSNTGSSSSCFVESGICWMPPPTLPPSRRNEPERAQSVRHSRLEGYGFTVVKSQSGMLFSLHVIFFEVQPCLRVPELCCPAHA